MDICNIYGNPTLFRLLYLIGPTDNDNLNDIVKKPCLKS